MDKFTAKTTGLVLLSMISLSAWGQPPWMEEEAAAAEQKLDPPTETAPAEGSPAEMAPAEMTEQAPQPAAAQQQTVVQQQTGDVLAQPVAVKLLDFPRRGMSTQAVEKELGRPSEMIPAVGDPPISRWVYDDRIVYFEYSSVIHVVAK